MKQCNVYIATDKSVHLFYLDIHVIPFVEALKQFVVSHLKMSKIARKQSSPLRL